MNGIELDIMKGLVSILNSASDAYYNSGTPIMTDSQFDARLNDLKQLEEETGFAFSNSPTQNVGYKVLTELKEIKHNHPMLSLEKVHSTEELIKFANNKELVASIKLDGCSVALTYENGILVKGESRGDGYIGNDITEHVKQFVNVPLMINKKETYLVYGEAIIEDDDFAEINKNEEYKNSRNLASGTLSVLDTSLVAKRRLKFYVWDVIEGGSDKLIENLTESKQLGFDVVPKWLTTNFNHENLQDNINYVFNFAKEEGLPCDGVVFKFNDIKYGKSLGATNHHFKNGVAYKKQNTEAETILKNIEWGIGKHGTLTPVAIFEPVELCGTTVERASLHNLSVMYGLWGKSWYSGLTLTVCKANDIIPMVTSVKSVMTGHLPKRLDAPLVCPICGGKTEIKQDNDSKVLVCTNDNCKGKLLGKLTHFVSKNAMNIDGLSEQTLDKFIRLGFVNSFADIYELKSRFYDELIELNGFGKKSIDKLIDSIEASKITTLDRFIYSLSIPLIGKSASKTIAKYFDYNFDKMITTITNPYEFFIWKELEDFGDAMDSSMATYMFDNLKMVKELASYFTFEKSNKLANNKNDLLNRTFVITGNLNHFGNRDELTKKIESLGGKVSSSVSSKTSYLVNNDINSTSGKNKKAKELNVPIITEEELIKMLNT